MVAGGVTAAGVVPPTSDGRAVECSAGEVGGAGLGRGVLAGTFGGGASMPAVAEAAGVGVVVGAGLGAVSGAG